jgi:hypothetical protein
MVKWNMTENSANDKEKENPGPVGSGEKGTGPNSPEAKEKQIMVRRKTAPRLVERATALRGLGIGRPPEPKSSHRRRTTRDIYDRDPEIPYVKFETAARDRVCSLTGRQDRMNEEIFYRINDPGYRVGDLERGRQADGGRK